MSPERFDELTKTLARTSSRRSFLVVVGSATAGAMLGRFGTAAAWAGGPGGSGCANHGQSCAAQKCCQGLSCVTDETNSTKKFCVEVCGVEGAVCGPNLPHCCEGLNCASDITGTTFYCQPGVLP